MPPSGQNRCLNCGANPYPRTFYCSDECSEEHRAQNTAGMSGGRKR